MSRAIKIAMAQNLPKTLGEIRELAAALAKGSFLQSKATFHWPLPVNLIQPARLEHFDTLVRGA